MSPFSPQRSQSTGYFELQLISVENVNGELADGECCDGPRSSVDLRCTRDECDTYFKICLKEYQAEVTTGGLCTYGAGATQVLGGNMFSLRSASKVDDAGKVQIPFQFAWPVSELSNLPPPCTSFNESVGSVGVSRCGTCATGWYLKRSLVALQMIFFFFGGQNQNTY